MVRASNRYLEGHGFDSRWGLRKFLFWVFWLENASSLFSTIVVTIHMKIYKTRVLDLSFPRRAFVFTSVALSKIQQRYLCQLWRVGITVCADWLIIFVPMNDVSRTAMFHQAGQGHVVSRIKTSFQRMYIYPYRYGIRQATYCESRKKERKLIEKNINRCTAWEQFDVRFLINSPIFNPTGIQ